MDNHDQSVLIMQDYMVLVLGRVLVPAPSAIITSLLISCSIMYMESSWNTKWRGLGTIIVSETSMLPYQSRLYT